MRSGVLQPLYDVQNPIPGELRSLYLKQFELPAYQRLSRGVSVPISYEVHGDEELILRFLAGSATAARRFKRQRRDLAKRVVLPELRRQIPNTRGRFFLKALIHGPQRKYRPRREKKKWHLAETPRIASSTLEGVQIVVGSPFNWYPNILHNRTGPFSNRPNPFATRTLKNVEGEWVRGHDREMIRFLEWLRGQNAAGSPYRGV